MIYRQVNPLLPGVPFKFSSCHFLETNPITTLLSCDWLSGWIRATSTPIKSTMTVDPKIIVVLFFTFNCSSTILWVSISTVSLQCSRRFTSSIAERARGRDKLAWTHKYVENNALGSFNQIIYIACMQLLKLDSSSSKWTLFLRKTRPEWSLHLLWILKVKEEDQATFLGAEDSFLKWVLNNKINDVKLSAFYVAAETGTSSSRYLAAH